MGWITKRLGNGLWGTVDGDDPANPPAVTATVNIPAGTEVKITDGIDDLEITAAGAAKIDGSAVTQPISATSLPLPTGASTEATLAAIKAKTDNLDVALSTRTKPADSQTVTGTLAATQSGTWQEVPNRPSQGSGRTYKDGVASAITGNTTVYTVTSSKKLYITSISFSGFNTSTTTAGRIDIKDSSTVKMTITVPTAGVGALSSSIPANVSAITFMEPKQFSTDFNIAIVGGTITFSCSFTGYEE